MTAITAILVLILIILAGLNLVLTLGVLAWITRDHDEQR